MFKRLAISALISALFICGNAWAQGVIKVYVLPYQPIYNLAPDDVARQGSEILKNEISNYEGFRIVVGPEDDEEAVEEEITPTASREADINKGQKEYEKAKKFMDEKKWTNALKSLETALKNYEDGLVSLTDYESLVRLHLDMAVCHYRSRKEDAGDLMLATVARLAPELSLSDEEFPGFFIAKFENIRKNVLTAPRGKIKVTSDIEGARVFLNGFEVATTPAMLNEVVKGDHYLKVEASGGRMWAKKIPVQPLRTEEITANFLQASGKGKSDHKIAIVQNLRDNTIDFTVKDRAQRLSNQIGADFIVLGGVAQQGNDYTFATYLYRASGNQITSIGNAKVGMDMLNASIELYKIGSDTANKMENFGSPIMSSKIQLINGLAKKASPINEVVAQPKYAPPAKGAPPAAAAPVPGIGPAAPGPAAPAAPPPGPAAPRPGPAAGPVVAAAPEQPPEDFWSKINQPGAGEQQAATTSPVMGDPASVGIIEYVPWYERWYVWTIVGAVVVAGATVGIILAQPGPPEKATATFNFVK